MLNRDQREIAAQDAEIRKGEGRFEKNWILFMKITGGTMTFHKIIVTIHRIARKYVL